MRAGRSGRANPEGGLVGSEYPQYLLENIPPDLRSRLSVEAERMNVSVSDVVRGLLCARYGLDCPPESFCYEPSRDKGKPTMLLRLQPRVASELNREARRTGMSKRTIILDTLDERFS